jgi:DNA-directed RNA polymerase subunit beta
MKTSISPMPNAVSGSRFPKKFFKAYRAPLAKSPNLVEPQVNSFDWLVKEGLKEVFAEFSSIKDYSEKKFELRFLDVSLSEPKYDEYHAKENKLSYEGTLKARVEFINKMFGSKKEQEIFLADFPMMTNHGTFIITGIERVIVPQLARSFGVFFTSEEVKGKKCFGGKIIPSRGVWIEIETDYDGAIYVRIDRKRKFGVTSLLRVLGAETDSDIRALFAENEFAKAHLDATFAKDHAKTADESYLEIHKRLRDGEVGTVENAKEFIRTIFSEERYDISKVGRFRFNKRFGKPTEGKGADRRVINIEDIAIVVNNIINLNNTPDAFEDDIDHLGPRAERVLKCSISERIFSCNMNCESWFVLKNSLILACKGLGEINCIGIVTL